MPTDQLVTAGHVLKAVMELDRRGATRVLSDLEKLEPDLAEYLLEGVTRLHHQLTELGLSGSDVRKFHRRAEKIALVCLLALRSANRELWDKELGGPEAGSSDDPPPQPPP